MLPTLALAALCWFFALHLALCAAIAQHILQDQEIWLLLDALLKPAAVLLGASVLLATHLHRPQDRRRPRTIGLLLTATALLLVAPGMAPGRAIGAFLPFLLAFLAFAPLVRRLAARGIVLRTLAFALPALLATAAVGLMPLSQESSALNRLGLVAFEPNATWSYDFGQDANKDHYPVCTFVQNSLGYRDIEPPVARNGRKRLLLVGDSFIWGDGIATAQHTLGALLRARLEALAPGTYEVISAAYPGNGLYGYTRAVERLGALLHPDRVIIGFLGQPDLNPVDTQLLAEAVPQHRLLRGLAARLHPAQHLHEWSVENGEELGQTAASQAKFQCLFNRLAAHAQASGARVALLNYSGHAPQGAFTVPPQLEHIDSPEPLRYKGKSTELWYAKDNHPKPLLNQKLADILAARVMAR